MTRKAHTLMVVHAHPDDEASSTGGLLRFAAEQGHTTIVVTCTHGDLGEVKIPGLRLHPRQVPADRQRLALIRRLLPTGVLDFSSRFRYIRPLMPTPDA